MAKKFYAVKEGRKRGIFTSWEEAKQSIDGYKGAVYKGFDNKNDALLFLAGKRVEEKDELNDEIESLIECTGKDEVVAFVDGSYDSASRIASYGGILFSDGGREEEHVSFAYGAEWGEDFITLRNVAGEVEGVKNAISWAISHGKKKITVFYDYMGIEMWATGMWKANKKLTVEYKDFFHQASKDIDVVFRKVPAHSGIKYNEEVDKLAKQAIKDIL